jgi:hypothetical protein
MILFKNCEKNHSEYHILQNMECKTKDTIKFLEYLAKTKESDPLLGARYKRTES